MNRVHSCSPLFPAAVEQRDFYCSAWHLTKEEHTLSVVNFPFYCREVARRERCRLQAFSLSADYFTHMAKWLIEFRAGRIRAEMIFFIMSCRVGGMLARTPTVSNLIILSLRKLFMIRCTRHNWRNGCSSPPITRPQPTLSLSSHRLLAAPH